MTPAKEIAAGWNKDQGLLRTVAILTMIVDHVGVMFFPSVIGLRIIGRIAFPLFAWGIAVGAEKTRDWRIYALRLFILALASQPFFMLALTHSWSQLNVLATLLLGMLAIQGIRINRYGSAFWGPALCLLLAAAYQMDYGWRGVLLILLMYLVRNSRGGLAALMVTFCLYWGGGGSILPQPVISFFTQTPLMPFNRAMNAFLSLFKLQSMAILALPIMLAPTRSGIRFPKWLSYAAYPGHLLILWLLSLVL